MFLVFFSFYKDRCLLLFLCDVSLFKVDLDYVEVREFCCNESLYFEVVDRFLMFEVEVYFIRDVVVDFVIKMNDVKC